MLCAEGSIFQLKWSKTINLLTTCKQRYWPTIEILLNTLELKPIPWFYCNGVSPWSTSINVEIHFCNLGSFNAHHIFCRHMKQISNGPKLWDPHHIHQNDPSDNSGCAPMLWLPHVGKNTPILSGQWPHNFAGNTSKIVRTLVTRMWVWFCLHVQQKSS